MISKKLLEIDGIGNMVDLKKKWFFKNYEDQEMALETYLYNTIQ